MAWYAELKEEGTVGEFGGTGAYHANFHVEMWNKWKQCFIINPLDVNYFQKFVFKGDKAYFVAKQRTEFSQGLAIILFRFNTFLSRQCLFCCQDKYLK